MPKPPADFLKPTPMEDVKIPVLPPDQKKFLDATLQLQILNKYLWSKKRRLLPNVTLDQITTQLDCDPPIALDLLNILKAKNFLAITQKVSTIKGMLFEPSTDSITLAFYGMLYKKTHGAALKRLLKIRLRKAVPKIQPPHISLREANISPHSISEARDLNHPEPNPARNAGSIS